VPPLIISSKLLALNWENIAITVITDPLLWNHKLKVSEFGLNSGIRDSKHGRIATKHEETA